MLRTAYAMSSTAYIIVLRISQRMSGTGLGLSALARYALAIRWPVLTQAMLLPGRHPHRVLLRHRPQGKTDTDTDADTDTDDSDRDRDRARS
eukprot:13524-Rhodomonas_salina.1